MAKGSAGIGTKLTIDGEQEFKEALKAINTEMKSLTAQAKLTSAEYDKNTSTTQKLADAQKQAAEQVEKQREKVEKLKDIQQKAKEQLGENSDAYIKYTNQLANAENALKKMEDAQKDADNAVKANVNVVSKVKDVYDNAKQGVEEFKEAHPKLTKAVEVTGETLEAVAKGGFAVLKGAAEVGAAAVAALAVGAVEVGKALYESAEQAAEYGDNVDKASQKMGIATDEYQKLAYATELSGTSMDTLQAATKKLQAAGSELDISQALDQIYSIEDADERAAAAHEMFGDKIANELAPMLNQGAEGFNNAKKAAEEYGLVMSEKAVKASAEFADTKSTMIDTVTSIKNNLSAELLPGINEVMDGITGLFTGDESAMGKIEKGIDDLFKSLNGEDGIIAKVKDIFTRLVGAITEAAPTLIPALVDGLLTSLDVLIEAAFTLIDTLTTSLLTEENISLIMDSAAKLITHLVEFLSNNAGLLIDSAVTIVTTLIEAFSNPENSQTLVQGCIDMVGAIVGALIENAPQLLQATLEMGKALVEGLTEYDWGKLAKNIYSKIKDAIVGLFKGGKNDGGHAGGLDYVPYNGYSAVLHQGEKVLTAAEAEASRSNTDMSQLNAKVDYLMSHQQGGDVNINVSGSAGAVVRALNIEIEREGRRKSAWA